MNERDDQKMQQRLRSPRSAAAAGIIFSLLIGVIMIVVLRSLPADVSELSGDNLSVFLDSANLAIGLVPLAGIAFLWFMGVSRDLLGNKEDQFFSTVFTGSGLLFLAMTFVWASVGATLTYGIKEYPELVIGSGIYVLGYRMMRELMGTFALSMAGAYVFSTGTIWLRTGVVPRWMAFTSWGVAAVLIVSGLLPWWVQMLFPAWVFLVSFYILVHTRRYHDDA